MAPRSIWLARFLLFLILIPFVSTSRHTELDETVSEVECVECVVTWSISSHYSAAPNCSNPRICTGNACFKRHHKHNPLYRDVMGCLTLATWQREDIEFNKHEVERLEAGIGSNQLCEEDAFGQTTCVCNRSDQCNSLHLQQSHSTYAEGFFKGIINFDVVIFRIDPEYFSNAVPVETPALEPSYIELLLVPLVTVVIICLAFYGIYTLVMGCLAKRKKAEYVDVA